MLAQLLTALGFIALVFWPALVAVGVDLDAPAPGQIFSSARPLTNTR